jgi:hypothetical protein
MMRRLAAALAVLTLAACGTPEPKEPPGPAGLRPITVLPEPLDVPPIPEPIKDSCGAWEMRALVGKPRSQIPAPLYPDKRRVTCTTCPVTRDFRPDRMNILFDAETGIVEEITCG